MVWSSDSNTHCWGPHKNRMNFQEVRLINLMVSSGFESFQPISWVFLID